MVAKAYETVWLVGDDFMTRHYGEHFLMSDNKTIKDCFTKQNYDVRAFMSNQFTSNNRNVLSRIRNCFVKGVNDNYLLPKYIFLILDNDIIKTVEFDKYGTSVLFGKLTEWLANEIHKIIKTAKENKPMMAKRDNYPEIVWIEPPLHKNFKDNLRRKKMGVAMGNATKLFAEMEVLQMRKIWDYDEGASYLSESCRYTAEGQMKYWLAIDNLVKLWSSFLSGKKAKKLAGKSNKNTQDTKVSKTSTKVDDDNALKSEEEMTTHHNRKFVAERSFNRYKWTKPGGHRGGRILPQPPPRR